MPKRELFRQFWEPSSVRAALLSARLSHCVLITARTEKGGGEMEMENSNAYLVCGQQPRAHHIQWEEHQRRGDARARPRHSPLAVGQLGV